MVETKSRRTPKATSSGLSAMTMAVVVQLGLVTMQPSQPRSAFWRSSNAR